MKRKRVKELLKGFVCRFVVKMVCLINKRKLPF
nr:MAG TPA: hypothetical protein [Caudoviricetes sp.]